MRNKIIFALSILGVVAGLVAAYLFGIERKPTPPVFTPISNPYASAIYANGIVESEQGSGENITVFPEVAGPVTQVLVTEGQQVTAGTPLLRIDASVQRANAEQLRFQSQAALQLLQELKAQPRKETLAIAKAQVDQAQANLGAARDQYDKRRASFELNPKSISKDVVDTAKDAVDQAQAGLGLANRQYELTRAGAWHFDISNQEQQYQALKQAYAAAGALLDKFTLKAQADGVVMVINASAGSYVSPQGAYDTYTAAFNPVLVLSTPQEHLAVRCFVDEILIPKLPSAFHIVAQMQVEGSEVKIPLEFVRVQPFVSPKIELSNQRQERVDLRVLPVLFRFEKKDAPVYPGQLVDVFIGQK
jgi:HlyD family secretion protein